MRRVTGLDLLVGIVHFGGLEWDGREPLVFGGRPPTGLTDAESLIGASDDGLRAIDGPFAAIAVANDAAAILGGPGPTALYASTGERATAWSSHAVAAAWLATGAARVDPAALPEFVAAELAGGGRSLIQGARPVPPCTAIQIGPDHLDERWWWSGPERWRPVPEDEAQAEAERALVSGLERRLAGEPAPYLGLTAGLDSRVVAVAMREAGIDFGSFTWGEPEWDDATGAAAVAAAVQAEHHVQPARWLSDGEALTRVHATVRWSEGGRVEFAEATLPEDLSVLVTGGGGEAGRAFYYREESAARPEAGAEEAARVLAARLAFRLPGAEPEAHAALERAVEGWVAAAEADGVAGWRTLDHVYTEQRLRRWGRHMLVQSRGGLVPALGGTRVTRAVTSLPLAARRSDGFHRAFLDARRPDLTPEAPVGPRRSPLRRVAGRARRAVRGPAPLPADGGPPQLPGKWEWDDRPSMRDWVADEVLSSPLLAEGLGDGWLHAMRARFVERDGWAEEVAQWAAGPVALATALAELEVTSAT
jgi:hypothetical protein